MWWDILKNAKIRGKGKTGGKLDTSRLKVNVGNNSCERDFNAWFSEQGYKNEKNTGEFSFPFEFYQVGMGKPDEPRATEKEFCELLAYLKKGFADVLVSGLIMAIEHNLTIRGNKTYQYITFESSEGNIISEFKANKYQFDKKEYIDIELYLIFKTDSRWYGGLTKQFVVETEFLSNDQIGKIIKKVMFKW